MGTLYMPYSGEQPSSLYINGHKVLFLSTDQRSFEAYRELLALDMIRPLYTPETVDDLEAVINALARKNGASVVITPPSVPMSEVVRSLEKELPWLQ